MQGDSLFSTYSPAFVVYRVLNNGHSEWCEVLPHWDFYLHFSNNERCWTSFICLLGELLISVRNGRKVKVAQYCLTLCDPVDCIVLGILQARILEWVPFPWVDLQGIFPTQGSNPGLPHADGFFTSWATREAQMKGKGITLLIMCFAPGFSQTKCYFIVSF